MGNEKLPGDPGCIKRSCGSISVFLNLVKPNLYVGNQPVCCGKLVITTEISGSDKYQQGVSVVQGGVSESMMGATASVLQSQI
jgi:hypothetical protein